MMPNPFSDLWTREALPTSELARCLIDRWLVELDPLRLPPEEAKRFLFARWLAWEGRIGEAASELAREGRA